MHLRQQVNIVRCPQMTTHVALRSSCYER